MDTFVEWLRATPLSHGINQTTWLWPLSETIHFIGLALVIGVAGFFDLRLMGLFRRVPVAAAMQLLPFAALGFLFNVVTGLIFLIGLPEQYVHNRAWWIKVGFLAVAGLNVIVFNTTVSKRIVQLGGEEDTPLAAKAIGLVSLVAWLGVLYWGRMLPFIGDAY